LIATLKQEQLKTHNELEFERIRWESITLLEFVREFWSVIEHGRTFVEGKHIDAICQHLEAVSQGKILRLLVNMPPRHAKSTIISVFWPIWSWIKNPSLRWLCASYALNLATRDNVKCRRLILSPKFQERYGHIFQLTKDQNAKMKFETTVLGYRMAVSVGSSATGEGGDILLLDDPHSIEEKESDATREAALDWFNNTWSSRLNDQQTGAMVVVGQRIHSQDVSGHILETNDGEWTHLNLPALFEPFNTCRTYLSDGSEFWRDWRAQENELLWPARFPMSVLQRAQVRHGSMGFAALYQQRPVPAGGGQFKKKWFRYFTQEETHYCLESPEAVKRVLIEQCQKVITVDLAISQKQSADFTVIAVWAITPDREILLIDRLRDHLDNPEQQKQIQLLYQRYHPGYILIESVAYQLAIIQQLLRAGLPAKEYKPVKDKVSRASTAAVLYEAGRVYHPLTASWLPEWEDELLIFPMGAHDDQCDNVSMICDAVSGPLGSAGDHLEAIKRRVELQKTRTVAPAWPGSAR
jgi:predicted phage terminase large subunit-like protein